MLDSELKSKINLLWDKFWSGGISNPLQAIEQMSYLLFMKRLELEDIAREQNARLTGEKFISLFEDCHKCKWSAWSNMPADKILDHVRDKVFPFLRNLGEDGSLYRQYMKDSTFSIPTPSLLIEAVKIIESMHIKEQNWDTKGDLYEYLLSELKTAGKNGQFRTPRHIIRMMVELADPKAKDFICDPACGTAGFLVIAYEHILRNNTSPEFIKVDELGEAHNFKGDKLLTEDWVKLRGETFYGYDFDPMMVRVSLMNLMMHGIDNPNIKQINTLSNIFEEKNKYTVVLANPPFKGSIDESELSTRFAIRTKKTEILFLELMYDLLRVGGRCAVIVPDGVLFGNSNAHRQIREKLMKDCRLDAVISMPSGVFKPYAGVSTAVLFFTKGEATKQVWFYKMENDGFSLDDKRTYIDGKGDITDIVERFRKRKSENPKDRKGKCFFVPIEEIVENGFDLSLSKYKEIEYEDVKYEKPEVIKKKILERENKIIEGLNEIKV